MPPDLHTGQLHTLHEHGRPIIPRRRSRGRVDIGNITVERNRKRIESTAAAPELNPPPKHQTEEMPSIMSSPATRRSSRGATKASNAGSTASPGPRSNKRLSSSPATAIAIAQRRAAAAASAASDDKADNTDDDSSVWSRRPAAAAGARAGRGGGGGRGGKGSRVVAPAKGSVPIDPGTGLEDLDDFFRAATTEVVAAGGVEEDEGGNNSNNKKKKGRGGKKVRYHLFVFDVYVGEEGEALLLLCCSVSCLLGGSRQMLKRLPR